MPKYIQQMTVTFWIKPSDESFKKERALALLH